VVRCMFATFASLQRPQPRQFAEFQSATVAGAREITHPRGPE